MKNLKRNSIILFVISTIFIYFLVKNNFIETVRLIRSANALWILISFILFYLYVLLEAYVMQMIVVKHKKDYKFFDMFKLTVMAKFFNGITPFASGGQPLQVFELNKAGIKSTIGTMVVIQTFLVFQFTIIVLGIIAVISNILLNLFVFTPLMYWMIVIGFSLNIFVFLLVYTISYNYKTNQNIYKFITKIINKYKFIKNKEAKQLKLKNFFDEYYEGFKDLKTNKMFFIKIVIIEALALIALFIIPQCIFNALRIDHNLTLYVTTVISAYIFIVGSYIPIPGGTGGIEYSFLTFFKGFTTVGALTSSLILWRFVTYYSPVAIGGIVFNFFSKKD